MEQKSKEFVIIAPEAILRSHLLSNYHPDIRPLKNPLVPVTVNISLNIRQVVKLDEQNQIMTTSLLMYLNWIDEHMNWNPSKFSNITRLFISPKDIWIPDIVLFNSVDRAFSQNHDQYLATVHHSGLVQWMYADVARTYCPVTITLFPFDYQSCALEIQSWSRAKYELMPVYVPAAKMDCDEMKAEWDIKSVQWSNHEDNRIPWIKLVLIISRNSTFYLYHLIFPFFLLSCLTLFVFWLPPESGEKVTLTITILLALTVFLQLISNYTPKASENLPIIGIYFNINLILALVSVLMTILVLNVHFRGVRSSPVPRWVKKYVIHKIGSFICVHNAKQQTRTSILETNCIKELCLMQKQAENDRLCKNAKKTMSRSDADENDTGTLQNIHLLTHELNNYVNQCSNDHSGTFDDDDDDDDADMKRFIADEIIECKHLIEKLQEKNSTMSTTINAHDYSNDWRTLAIVIDRICFLVYLVCVAVSITFFTVKYSQFKNKM